MVKFHKELIIKNLEKFPFDLIKERFITFSNAIIATGIVKDNKELMSKTRGLKPIFTKEFILEEYKKLSEKLGRVPSKNDVNKNIKTFSSSTIIKYFGGFENIQILCGFTSNKNNIISNDELLNNLQNIINKLEKIPSRDEIDKFGKYSSNAYKRAFGSISKAIFLLGYKPTKARFKYSEKELYNEIIRIKNKLGYIPTIEEFCKISLISYKKIKSTTKNMPWHCILIKAGINDIDIKKLMKHGISNNELKEEIIRLKNKIGRYPTYYDVRRESKFSDNTYHLRFGSWAKTMHALGFSDYVSQSVFHNQQHILGKDGITYRSRFEARIADSLFDLLENDKILNYEYEKKVCYDKTWTCDFVIKKLDGSELWIEADGMAHNRKEPYDIRNPKIKYYIDNKMKYFILSYRKNIENDLLNCINS